MRDRGEKYPRFQGIIPGKNPRDSGEKSPQLKSDFFLAAGQTRGLGSRPARKKKQLWNRNVHSVGTFVVYVRTVGPTENQKLERRYQPVEVQSRRKIWCFPEKKVVWILSLPSASRRPLRRAAARRRLDWLPGKVPTEVISRVLRENMVVSVPLACRRPLQK